MLNNALQRSYRGCFVILFYSAQNLFKSVVMFLIMAVGGLIRILKNVVGGTCLGFAPRSESFAIEPLVQVCSISSLSEFRFAQYVRKSAMPNLQIFTSDQTGE